MTDLKEFYTNGAECDEICETAVSIPLITSYTVEDILAKYLTDFAIEEDTVLGYLNDMTTFKEILSKMKDLGFAFSVRDSDARQKQREKVQKVLMNGESSENERSKFPGQLTIFYQLKAMPIRFFGLPFTINKTTHYQCAYGSKYYKSRAAPSKKLNSSEFKQIKKKKQTGSKKMGCLAKMTIKHVTVYPGYRLEIESDWRKKKKLIQNLRKCLSENSREVEQFPRFYLSVSLQSSHNHPPIITKPKSKAQKSRSHKIYVKNTKPKRTEKQEEILTSEATLSENTWGYIELASSTLNQDIPKVELPVKSLGIKEDNFFHTSLVKFPNMTSAIFEQVQYKPDEIEIEIKAFEPSENISAIEVYQSMPTIQDLQTLFKEKLKSLYTLCNSCENPSLILRLVGDLEQVEMQLSSDINISAT